MRSSWLSLVLLSLLLFLGGWFVVSFGCSNFDNIPQQDDFLVEVRQLDKEIYLSDARDHTGFLGVFSETAAAGEGQTVFPIPLLPYHSILLEWSIDLEGLPSSAITEDRIEISVRTLNRQSQGFAPLIVPTIVEASALESVQYTKTEGYIIDIVDDIPIEGLKLLNRAAVIENSLPPPDNQQTDVTLDVIITYSREVKVVLYRSDDSVLREITYFVYPLAQNSDGHSRSHASDFWSGLTLSDIHERMLPYFTPFQSRPRTSQFTFFFLFRNSIDVQDTATTPSGLFKGYASGRTMRVDLSASTGSISRIYLYAPNASPSPPDLTISPHFNPLFGPTATNQGGVGGSSGSTSRSHVVSPNVGEILITTSLIKDLQNETRLYATFPGTPKTVLELLIPQDNSGTITSNTPGIKLSDEAKMGRILVLSEPDLSDLTLGELSLDPFSYSNFTATYSVDVPGVTFEGLTSISPGLS